MTPRDRDRELARLQAWVDARRPPAPKFGPREMVIEVVCALACVGLGWLWLVMLWACF